MAIPPRLVAFAIAIAPGVAQVPAHATLLNPATFQLAPTLLQDGDIVHAFAIGSPSGVLHARSLDGGRTWPLREQPLGPFLVSWSSNNPQAAVPVAARPGELLVVVDESTQGPLLLRSTDAGTTWAAPIPIAATVAGLARR
ncbi:MAG: exo-alpha-sialidase, partial [Planctomycetes bacterium]|nr:exo-alpha-sialidase [Planctomycetota bacterium]